MATLITELLDALQTTKFNCHRCNKFFILKYLHFMIFDSTKYVCDGCALPIEKTKNQKIKNEKKNQILNKNNNNINEYDPEHPQLWN